MSLNHIIPFKYSKKNELITNNHTLFTPNKWVKMCCNSSNKQCKNNCNYNRVLYTNKKVKQNSFSYFDIQPDIIFNNIDVFANISIKSKTNGNLYKLF